MTSSESVPATTPQDSDERRPLKAWHRWVVLDVTWMGLPIPPELGFAQGFVTRHGAQRRLARGRRYGIERTLQRRSAVGLATDRFKCRRGHPVQPCMKCGEPSQCGELTCVEHTS